MIQKDVNREELANQNSHYAMQKLEEMSIPDTHWLYRLLKYKTLPRYVDVKNECREFMMHSFYARDVYTQTYGFPLITAEVVTELASHLKGKNVLELAAGSGYLSSLLQQRGIQVKVTDNFNWANGNYGSWKKPFTEVESIDALKAIEKYGDDYDVVLLSWPPYDNPLAHQILLRCLEKNLDMIYIGEDIGGCTADDDFFDLVEEKCTCDFVSDYYIPFNTIHDNIWEIKRKEI